MFCFVFLRLPKGCGDLSGRVVRLDKNLYGLKHVPSEYQHADILTKVLAFDLFAIHRCFLMNLND